MQGAVRKTVLHRLCVEDSDLNAIVAGLHKSGNGKRKFLRLDAALQSRQIQKVACSKLPSRGIFEAREPNQLTAAAPFFQFPSRHNHLDAGEDSLMHGQFLRRQFHIPFDGRIIRRGCPLIEGIILELRGPGLRVGYNCRNGEGHGRERGEERGMERHRNLNAA